MLLPPAPPEFHYVSFIPLPKIESNWTIAHLRENLASIIRSLEHENYSSLERINLDLYEQTQKIVDIKLEDFKNDKTSFSCHQITRYYDLQGRDVLLKFSFVHDSEDYHSHLANQSFSLPLEANCHVTHPFQYGDDTENLGFIINTIINVIIYVHIIFPKRADHWSKWEELYNIKIHL